MRETYLLFFAICLLGCEKTEESITEFFVPDGQFVEVAFSDGQYYRLEVVPFAMNTTQFYYDPVQLLGSGFINRKSLDGSTSSFLNFNPRLPDNVFSEAGVFIPDSLQLPYVIPLGTFQLSIEAPNNEWTEYFFQSVDVTIESWEDDIVTGSFQQDPLLLNIDSLIVNRGDFRVYLQTIQY